VSRADRWGLAGLTGRSSSNRLRPANIALPSRTSRPTAASSPARHS